MLLEDDIQNLNVGEIKEMIVATKGEDRLFYVSLLNKVMQLKRSETLEKERKFGNYNQIKKGT